jgi:hypothetical protein
LVTDHSEVSPADLAELGDQHLRSLYLTCTSLRIFLQIAPQLSKLGTALPDVATQRDIVHLLIQQFASSGGSFPLALPTFVSRSAMRVRRHSVPPTASNLADLSSASSSPSATPVALEVCRCRAVRAALAARVMEVSFHVIRRCDCSLPSLRSATSLVIAHCGAANAKCAFFAEISTFQFNNVQWRLRLVG